jgi:hypothetical protein
MLEKLATKGKSSDIIPKKGCFKDLLLDSSFTYFFFIQPYHSGIIWSFSNYYIVDDSLDTKLAVIRTNEPLAKLECLWSTISHSCTKTTNKLYIAFSFNSPFIRNTTYNSLELVSLTSSSTSEITVFEPVSWLQQNPFRGRIWIFVLQK